MVSATQDELFYLSSKFSKTLKRRSGKGPETCYVVLIENKLLIQINNFMVPAEEVLLESDQVDLAYQFRSAVMDVICKEFIQEISSITGVSFHSSFHDWNYDTNKGIVIIETSHSQPRESNDFPFEKTLFDLIKRVSSKEHKVPDQFRIVKWNQNVCIVECKGVILSIERYLYQNGYSDILWAHSREMKTNLVSYKDQFESLFNRPIEDFFIIWNYDQDKKYIVFNLY
jgi:uncharacterized protein YbcI